MLWRGSAGVLYRRCGAPRHSATEIAGLGAALTSAVMNVATGKHNVLRASRRGAWGDVFRAPPPPAVTYGSRARQHAAAQTASVQ